MSTENLSKEGKKYFSKPKLGERSKVDINILLNKVREEHKKENIEKSLFIGIISISILSFGLILSA